MKTKMPCIKIREKRREEKGGEKEQSRTRLRGFSNKQTSPTLSIFHRMKQ